MSFASNHGPLFEGFLIEHHMRPDGCRLLDVRGLVDGRGSVDSVEWTLSHDVTGPCATKATVLCGRREVEHVSMDAFAEHLAVLRGLLDATHNEGLVTLATACRRRPPVGAGSESWKLVRDDVLADIRDALVAVTPSLDRLDPVALAGSVDGVRRRANGLYALFDMRTDPDAPLGVASAMRPHFRGAWPALFNAHGPAIRAAARARDPAALDAVLVRSMTVGTGGSARAAGLGSRVSDAMDAMSPEDIERVRAGCRVRTHRPGNSDLDPPYALGRLLAGLPGDWVPRDVAGWLDLAWCAPALAHADRRCAPGAAHLMLHAGGGWAGLRRRLGTAAGLPADAGPDRLGSAIRDVHDMAAAFEAQVLRPARHLSGIRGARDGGDVAEALLHDGRTLRRSLEMSARWHGAQQGISAALAALPGAAVRSWPAALPGWSWDGVDLVVLTDAAQLLAEGAAGPDADGVMGLGHCVGTYAGSCLSGSSRIVSLRRPTPSGTVRLSTAQLRFSRDGLALVQHQGPGNADPCREAHAALAAYAGAIHDGRLQVDEGGLGPVPDRSLVSGGAGYDVDVSGNWERALALWAPHLPRHLRGADRETLARLFGRPRGAFLSDMQDVMVDIHGRGEHWLPTPFHLTGHDSGGAVPYRTSGGTSYPAGAR